MIRSFEFQKLLSFSWNCEVMVPSAFSHSLSRPSYFGPDSPKFSSHGQAACAGWPEERANRAARPIALSEVARSRMFSPEKGSQTVAWTVPPRPGAVKCNTATLGRNPTRTPPGVLFLARGGL